MEMGMGIGMGIGRGKNRCSGSLESRGSGVL